MTESEKDAQARWIIRRDEPACTCNPQNPKHREGWQCVTKEHLRAFKAYVAARHGTLPPHFTRLNDIKRLAWLWLHYDQDPEARRLSGRVVALEEADRLKSVMDLDAWDDAAGMSELEKRMFP